MDELSGQDRQMRPSGSTPSSQRGCRPRDPKSVGRASPSTSIREGEPHGLTTTGIRYSRHEFVTTTATGAWTAPPQESGWRGC